MHGGQAGLTPSGRPPTIPRHHHIRKTSPSDTKTLPSVTRTSHHTNPLPPDTPSPLRHLTGGGIGVTTNPSSTQPIERPLLPDPHPNHHRVNSLASSPAAPRPPHRPSTPSNICHQPAPPHGKAILAKTEGECVGMTPCLGVPRDSHCGPPRRVPPPPPGIHNRAGHPRHRHGTGHALPCPARHCPGSPWTWPASALATSSGTIPTPGMSRGDTARAAARAAVSFRSMAGGRPDIRHVLARGCDGGQRRRA